MFSTFVAPPEHLQPQSALLNLPAEIKHQIFGLCLTSDNVITDPALTSDTQSNAAPSLGVALLQTCRRLYHEVDRRPLFSRNTFRFTTVDTANAFLKTLEEDCRQSVHDIEIDVRNVHSDRLAHEWKQYLAWAPSPGNKFDKSLCSDAPNLRTLRLNFESWPRIPLFRLELWKLLRQLLANVRGLDRIVVVGASKGQAMARRDPWSPAHFVGADDVEFNDLVPRMWRGVGAASDAKVIRWVRKDGRLYLEVVAEAHLLRHIDGDWPNVPSRRSYDEPWPVGGHCSWSEYEACGPNATEPMTKDLNPSASG